MLYDHTSKGTGVVTIVDRIKLRTRVLQRLRNLLLLIDVSFSELSDTIGVICDTASHD